MALWSLFALMTAAAIFAVLWPLRSGRTIVPSGSELAVYRDQLDEIDRDRKAGMIGGAEAEAARVEVARRLIAADDAEKAASSVRGGAVARRRWAALAALIALPAGAVALYATFGSPDLPGQPLAARVEQPKDGASFAQLLAQVEAHLERSPEDGRGWELLAPVYLKLGRFEDAVKARQNALRLLGATSEREVDYGEALAGAANGIVTADAKSAFERALARDAGNVRARFYLGLAAEQDGKPEEAARAWRELVAAAPAGAPWAGFVREALARVGGADTSVAAARGPSTEDMAAASEMSDEQRGEMIRGMVGRLAERLKSNGSDPDGWLRLARAYMVLGDRDKARAAVGDGRRALANEPDKLRQLEDGAKGLGIEG
jgi:cytochrome c-type biogenesis protein CcmH